MKITLTLVDPEEHLTVDPDARDRRAYERAGYKVTGRAGPMRQLMEEAPDTYLGWSAWHCLRRQGLVTCTWDEFDARLAEVSPDKGDTPELGDPTNGATSGD